MKTNKANVKFDNRTRFNWGFHDAVATVKNGWDNEAKNFGFGSALSVSVPSDVLAQHFDSVYAEGWMMGWDAAKNSKPTESSEPAWIESTKCGRVN